MSRRARTLPCYRSLQDWPMSRSYHEVNRGRRPVLIMQIVRLSKHEVDRCICASVADALGCLLSRFCLIFYLRRYLFFVALETNNTSCYRYLFLTDSNPAADVDGWKPMGLREL